MKYSATAKGFYDEAIHAEMMPQDAVDVADSVYRALLDAQAAGKVITADASGHPVAVDPATMLSLPQAQAAQVAILTAAYQAAIAQLVTYTTQDGMTKAFQAGAGSVANVTAALLGLSGAQATPAGFYWLSADNSRCPFTYADLQGLAAAMLAQWWSAFQHLQDRKTAVSAATSVTDALAISW